MRAVLIALAGFTAIIASPASAQMYPPNVPVCLQVFGRNSYTECSYASIAQCQMTASGRPAQCIENPYFIGRNAPGLRRDRKVRREY